MLSLPSESFKMHLLHRSLEGGPGWESVHQKYIITKPEADICIQSAAYAASRMDPRKKEPTYAAWVVCVC